MVERYNTPVQSILTTAPAQTSVPYAHDLVDSLDADVAEIETAARQQVDAQLLEKENNTLEDKIKDEASNTLLQIQTSLSTLYQEFKSLPEKAHTYTDENGMTVAMNARGLQITLDTSNAKVTIAYAPKKLERILSGSTQKLRIKTTFHERLRAGYVWKDDEQPSVRKPLSTSAFWTGVSAAATYAAYSLATMPAELVPQGDPSLSFIGTASFFCAVGAAGAAVPAMMNLIDAAKTYLANRRLGKEAERKGNCLSTTGTYAVEDAEQTLPLLRVAAEALEEAKERTYAHTYRAQKEVAIKGLIDQQRIGEIKQRHAKLKRLLSNNAPVVAQRKNVLKLDDDLRDAIRRHVQNA